jgi:hypothetical protein
MVERIRLTSERGFPRRSLDQLLRDIAVNREGISKTVERLGVRIDETLDWRIHVARHPYLALSAAAGLGLWLSGLFKSGPTPAGRVLDALSQAAEAVTNGLNESLKKGETEKAAPSALIALLGTTVARAGIDFLFRKADEVLRASEMPNDGVQTLQSNGSSTDEAHMRLITKSPLRASNH